MVVGLRGIEPVIVCLNKPINLDGILSTTQLLPDVVEQRRIQNGGAQDARVSVQQALKEHRAAAPIALGGDDIADSVTSIGRHYGVIRRDAVAIE